MSRESLESRTNEKIEFASIHLRELRENPEWNPSSAITLAHEESCLFHAVGAKDAFLLEINTAYGLGVKKVNERKLAAAFKKTKKTSLELDEIKKLRDTKTSWLAVAIELRNHGTHRGRVARSYDLSGVVCYKHPEDGTEIPQSISDFLGSIIGLMEDLIGRLRQTLPW